MSRSNYQVGRLENFFGAAKEGRLWNASDQVRIDRKLKTNAFPTILPYPTKTLGKTLPSGLIDKAALMIQLAIHLFAGRSQVLSAWSCPFGPL